MHDEDSQFLHHSPCEACGSSDANAVYTDNHAFCFTCGAYTPGDGEPTKPRSRPAMPDDLILEGEVRGLRKRGIKQETCQKFQYKMVREKTGTAQIAPYFDGDGNLVAQKVRRRGKKFSFLGNSREALPFGAQAWPKTGKKIVVTEGEIDAMAMSQVQGNSWPVVSIACGAGPQVRKYIAKHREYFSGFDEVVLMFDMDPPGREASQVAAEVLGSRARIAELPDGFKDPADMLTAGQTKDLINSMWRAAPYHPEGIVDLASLKDQIKQAPKEGLSWCFPALTALTYGKRTGELVALGAGTGVGKTDFLTQDMLHMVQEHGEKIGVFALEQTNRETGLRLVGKAATKPLHIPDYWDEGIFEETWEDLVKDRQVFLYNSFGINTWSSIRDKIEYLFHSEGVRYFYLDHLTALAAAEDDERRGLEAIMAELGSLVKAIDVHVTFVSHLATPDGKPHEEGGRVMIRHFKGSRAIGFWSHYMVGLERDQQNEKEAIRSTTTVRVLKDRYTGRSTGQVFFLGYDHETGLLYETSNPEDDAESHGFDTPVDEGFSDF